MTLLAIFANNILPIFLVAAVGFLMARYLHTDVKTLSRVTLYALSPCLVFNLLVTSKLSAGEFERILAFTLCSVLGIGIVAWLVTRPLRLDRATVSGFIIAVMFANGGNYGLPVTQFAFGDEALARATIYFVISVMLTYTVGIVVASSGRQSIGGALLGIFKLPVVYAVIAAAIVAATGITLPTGILRPIQLLNNAAIPVMVLVLGMQLERAAVPEQPFLVGLATVLRLVISTVLAFVLAVPLGLTGAARQAGILQAAMPTAVVTTILALEFEVAPAFVTGVVFVSTIVSMFTLTVLIAFLQ